jgi:hypothetical protein
MPAVPRRQRAGRALLSTVRDIAHSVNLQLMPGYGAARLEVLSAVRDGGAGLGQRPRRGYEAAPGQANAPLAALSVSDGRMPKSLR